MENSDHFGPFSERGNDTFRRTGRTILSRGALGDPRNTPMSRTEAQGALIPTLQGEELESARALDEARKQAAQEKNGNLPTEEE
jgi:hypothetical protein